MTKSFGSLVFTPIIRALQERYGSRRQYERMEELGGAPGGLGSEERDFLSQQDTFFMASLGATGWPYVQHRGGPKGFLKVIDDHTIAFADFRGNKQYISTGNLMTDNRVALILVDFPWQLRLKILGARSSKEKKQRTGWRRYAILNIRRQRNGCTSYGLRRLIGIANSTSFRASPRNKFGKRWIPLRDRCRNW